jgi:hypothetical protein
MNMSNDNHSVSPVEEHGKKKYHLSVMSKKKYNDIFKTLQEVYPENRERAEHVMERVREIMNYDPSTTPGYTPESGKRFSEWRRKKREKEKNKNI